MDWEPKVHELFKKLVAQIPDAFRAMVEPLLKETAEKKAIERNTGTVNEADLITALLDITPEAFKAEAINNCTSLDIDMNRYTKLSDIKNEYQASWERFGKAFYPGNLHFAMYLTDKCNQKCLHCAAESVSKRPELAVEQWIQIVENLETGLREKGRRGVYIWFGGEPTCRKDIFELIKYCGKKQYFQAIITNGILFDEKFAKYCADNGMSHVFVSLDSADPAKSDRIRGKKDSLEFAKKAISNALKYGLFTCCSTTVTKLNIDELDDIKTLSESLGAQPYFRAVVRQKNAAKNWEKIGLSSDDYKRLYDFKYDLAIEAIRSGQAGKLLVYEVFEMVPFMEHLRDDRELTALEWGVGCQACRSLAGIDVNGDIFPCGYPSVLTLGNALNDSFANVLNSQLYKDIQGKKRIGKCGDCHHLSLCGGGCRVHAECESGNYFESFSYCWHQNDHEHDVIEGHTMDALAID